MPLKTRSQFPPGGWQFFDARLKWNAPTPLASTFDQTVAQIIAIRQNNKGRHPDLSTDYNAVAEQLDKYTCTRLGNDAHWCMGIQKKTFTSKAESSMEINPKSKDPWSSALARLVGVKRIAGGARILSDWLGSGGIPVSQHDAQSRADICLQCPKNTAGGFVASRITKPIADAIHEQLRVKHDLGLKVNRENELLTCAVCYCNLPLKVFTPMEFILKHTTDDVMNEFPENCWIKKAAKK